MAQPAWVESHPETPSSVQAPAARATALASGNPAALGIDVVNNFFYVNATNDRYAYGVRIENSWSAGWGNNGFATLSWNFVNQHAFSA